MLRMGQRRVTQLGTLRKKPTIPRRVSQTREATEGLRDSREVVEVLTHQAVSQGGGRGRNHTINIRGEVGCVRPTTGGKTPTKIS